MSFMYDAVLPGAIQGEEDGDEKMDGATSDSHDMQRCRSKEEGGMSDILPGNSSTYLAATMDDCKETSGSFVVRSSHANTSSWEPAMSNISSSYANTSLWEPAMSNISSSYANTSLWEPATSTILWHLIQWKTCIHESEN